MKPPSIEFMMIAARGISLALAFITLAWAIVRWRRDVTRDAQRVFEQLDLVRAELLQLQGQVDSRPTQKAVVANQAHYQPSDYQSSNYPSASTPSVSNSRYQSQASQSVNEPEPRRTASLATITKANSFTNAAPRGYEAAARLARSGASAEELMNSCALSRHEAELLVRLHAGMKSLQPPANTAATAPAKKDQRAGTGDASRINTNTDHLKNIGTRSNYAGKPSASLTNRPASTLRPAQHQRVSLVG